MAEQKTDADSEEIESKFESKFEEETVAAAEEESRPPIMFFARLTLEDMMNMASRRAPHHRRASIPMCWTPGT